MMTEHVEFHVAIDRAHERLHDAIEELEQWWEECREYGIPRFGEMGGRIHQLRTHLAEHFAWEEEGGYLHDVLDDVPHLDKRAESLRRQHDAMLAECDHLVAELHQNEPPFASWNEAHERLATLLDRLSKHEHAEGELVQEAVQSDVGTKD